MTGTETFVATCTNSVTPDSAELSFAITGTAPAKVNAGDTVTLSDQSWTVSVPASVINTGLGLGLLQIGDTVSGTVTPALFASNTEEGTRVLSPIAVQIGPIEDDGTSSTPPKAKPVSATFAVPDTSWTTVGGTVGYSLGSADVLVAIGPIEVGFSCEPNDLTLSVVETEVVGSTGVPPAGRPGGGGTTATTAAVKGTQTTQSTSTLPKTGSDLLVPVAVAVGLLDLGYLLLTATRATGRRRPDIWT